MLLLEKFKKSTVENQLICHSAATQGQYLTELIAQINVYGITRFDEI